MRFSDLLTMSVNNLFRRKLRTFLTVLGVVIGTASIVVMVSIGIGLKEFTIKQYSSYGSLTAIQVYNYDNGNSSDKKNPEDSFMTDETMKTFEKIPHVTSDYASGCLRGKCAAAWDPIGSNEEYQAGRRKSADCRNEGYGDGGRKHGRAEFQQC